MTSQNEFDTRRYSALVDDTSLGWVRAITRPVATTARMPLTPRRSATRNTTNGIKTS